MASVTYHVSDLDIRLPNGVIATIIDGQVEVDFDLQDAEPDVGISEGYVADFTIEAGEIEVVFTEDQPAAVALVLAEGHPVLKQIAQAKRNSIEQACLDEAAEDYWTDRWNGR